MPRGRLTLVQSLTAQYGKGCDERNLHHMRAFYLTFPIRNALRTELSLTHHCTLDNPAASTWYMSEAIGRNGSIRTLLAVSVVESPHNLPAMAVWLDHLSRRGKSRRKPVFSLLGTVA